MRAHDLRIIATAVMAAKMMAKAVTVGPWDSIVAAGLKGASLLRGDCQQPR